ncbi:Glycosyl transferase family 2 [Lachnospiraceae bacterium A10]|nr:Glycosyl transferase family 2 [Lachnospiraceae bacterium A10]
MKLSVIMPSLNVADYIEQCIVSVQKQSLKDIEIICVDAGSTDGTREILQKYADEDARIKIIDSSVKSYGYQMNLGLDAAQGEYIGIVETDDYVSDDMFEKLYEKTRKEHPDFVKSSYFEFFDYDGKTYGRCVRNVNIEDRNGELIDLDNENNYRLADINHIWSAIYKRDFLKREKIRFHETAGASFQDTSFSILVGLTAKTCIYLNDCYYHYRIDRLESSVKSDSKVDCIIKEMNYVYKFMEEQKMDTGFCELELISKKLDVYLWNARRLSGIARETFMEMIQDNMILIKKSYYTELDKERQSYLEQLIDINRLNKEEALLYEQRMKLVSYIKGLKGKRCILVGAGRYFDKLNEIQQVMGEKYIQAVCDNSKSLWDREVNGYVVQSVYEAIEQYKGEKWLIANRKYSEEIKKQLLEGGIEESDIKVITYIPGALEFMGDYL